MSTDLVKRSRFLLKNYDSDKRRYVYHTNDMKRFFKPVAIQLNTIVYDRSL